MMTMEECLRHENTGKLVYHIRGFYAILTNRIYDNSDNELIVIIKQNGVTYRADPEFLTLLNPRDLNKQ